jgi:hypothetical protein
MPRAVSVNGQFRQIIPIPLPKKPIELTVKANEDSSVLLQWERSTETFGLTFNIYRNDKFITQTTAFNWIDTEAEVGRNKYSLFPESDGKKGLPTRVEVEVQGAQLREKVVEISAESLAGCVRLYWRDLFGDFLVPVSYEIWRQEAKTNNAQWNKITSKPITNISFDDKSAELGKVYRYKIRPVFLRGDVGGYSNEVESYIKELPRVVVFESSLRGTTSAKLSNGTTINGNLHGDAKTVTDSLLIQQRGELSFPNYEECNIASQIEVDFWVRVDELTRMPIFVSFGRWNDAGWFVQLFDGRLRWHCGGVDCDGGDIVVGKWTHIVCQFDGAKLRTIQDGKQVAEKQANLKSPSNWRGSLKIGNYSAGSNERYQLKGNLRDIKIKNFISKN